MYTGSRSLFLPLSILTIYPVIVRWETVGAVQETVIEFLVDVTPTGAFGVLGTSPKAM